MAPTFLCIATYRKGDEFLRELRRQGCRVLLLTEEKLRDGDWPREAIDEFFYIRRDMPPDDIRKGAAHLARTNGSTASSRSTTSTSSWRRCSASTCSCPGMGETTARAFRDKLAMRRRARSAGIACPTFVHVLNHAVIREWTDRVPPPWV